MTALLQENIPQQHRMFSHLDLRIELKITPIKAPSDAIRPKIKLSLKPVEFITIIKQHLSDIGKFNHIL